MSPAVLLAHARAAAAEIAQHTTNLRGHATDTRAAMYRARRALTELEDVLALRSGETLARGINPTGEAHDTP